MYISNNTISGVSLNDKYLELACDIYLNDETFDENGNPLGGDGTVYSWEPMLTGNGIRINGNGFSIKGLFCDNTDKNYVGLFERISAEEVANLEFDNVFLKGRWYVHAICYDAKRVTNCSINSGKLIGKHYVSGFCFTVQMCSNLINYAYIQVIENGSRASGIVNSTTQRALIADCVNYGKISVNGWSGGVLASVGDNSKILRCENHGNLSSTL